MKLVRSLPELEALLLTRRGVVAQQVEQFFAPVYAEAIHAPEKLSGMQAAQDRLRQARRQHERVLVYGDYDADGITATAIVVTALQTLGLAVTPYLPHRMDDGYALSQTVLEKLITDFDILIAVDCGISNGAEIAWLKSHGKGVIIVDHHELPAELPAADAILHPRVGAYPFPYLSGAGVAWKLAQALTGDGQALLDLAMLGTLADVVSLTGENRSIVKFGLEKLVRTKRAGLRALCQTCRLSLGNISAEDVAFRLIPRLNAAGRMDHPQPALNVLLAQEEAQAQALVRQLTAYNTQRQALTRQMMTEAEAMLEEDLPFVFVANLGWRAGLVGLAAGRLAEKFGRPAIVIGGNGRYAVGSARALPGGNVLEFLEAGREHVLKLGGHKRAAGFSLEEAAIAPFKAALAQAAGGLAPVAAKGLSPEAWLDGSLLSWDLLEMIERFAPFGEGNPKPLLAARAVPVLDCRLVGRGREHAKLMLGGAFEPVEAIGFGLASQAQNMRGAADIVFTVEANEFGGRRRMQLSLKDITYARDPVH